MRTPAALLLALLLPTHQAAGQTTTFDDHPVGKAPAGFTAALTGRGGGPSWVVRTAPEGQAGHVVVQESTDATSNRFPLLVNDKISATDMQLSVRFRSVSGEVDQAAGLVWRYQDANNYYIVRANALEDNVVLYKVEKGRRTDLPVKGQGRTYGAKAPVAKGQWSTLAVTVQGPLFTVSLNGQKLYDVEDKTFAGAGKVGLWTKADSVTIFDDLTVAGAK